MLTASATKYLGVPRKFPNALGKGPLIYIFVTPILL